MRVFTIVECTEILLFNKHIYFSSLISISSSFFLFRALSLPLTSRFQVCVEPLTANFETLAEAGGDSFWPSGLVMVHAAASDSVRDLFHK